MSDDDNFKLPFANVTYGGHPAAASGASAVLAEVLVTFMIDVKWGLLMNRSRQGSLMLHWMMIVLLVILLVFLLVVLLVILLVVLLVVLLVILLVILLVVLLVQTPALRATMTQKAAQNTPAVNIDNQLAT